MSLSADLLQSGSVVMFMANVVTEGNKEIRILATTLGNAGVQRSM